MCEQTFGGPHHLHAHNGCENMYCMNNIMDFDH